MNCIYTKKFNREKGYTEPKRICNQKRVRTVSVVLENDSAKLVVNDGSGMKTTYGTVTIDPVEVMSDNATYIIADGMNGSMDYFRVNIGSLSDETRAFELISGSRISTGGMYTFHTCLLI